MKSTGYRFSVVIPTYARPKSLRACLEALSEQAYPKQQFEVIVVDDGSPDPIEPVVSTFCGRLNISLARKQNGGPSSARNVGAHMARGRFLAFTDDDCTPARDWLLAFAARFDDQPQCMLGGWTVNRLADDLCAVSSQLLMDMLYRFYNPDAEAAAFFATNNVALPADEFAQLGGFNEDFCWAAAEDRELCDRWTQRGRRMVFVPEAIVAHAHHLSLPGFCRQHFTYGRGAVAYQRFRTQVGLGGLLGVRGFHARFLGLCWPLLKQLPPGRVPAVLCLLLLAQLSTLAGFVYESCRLRRLSSKDERSATVRDPAPRHQSIVP